MPLRVKRIYDRPEKADGVRFLVDRLWPRGLSKEDAAIDEWIRDIAPSAGLRRWFGHKPDRWDGFCRKYARELKASRLTATIRNLRKIARFTTVTLLYAATDKERNNAVALASFLNKRKVSSVR